MNVGGRKPSDRSSKPANISLLNANRPLHAIFALLSRCLHFGAGGGLFFFLVSLVAFARLFLGVVAGKFQRHFFSPAGFPFFLSLKLMATGILYGAWRMAHVDGGVTGWVGKN